jgi:hypothetical protein
VRVFAVREGTCNPSELMSLLNFEHLLAVAVLNLSWVDL